MVHKPASPDTGHLSRSLSDIQRSQQSRRSFLRLLGVGAAAGIGTVGTARGQESPVVAMKADAFDPIGLHVEPGTTVRFEIESGSHSATAYEDRIPTEAETFDSGVLSSGGFEHTFDTAGTYDYYCTPHKSIGMVGRIVVGDPGGPAESGSIPDGSVPDSEAIVEEGRINSKDSNKSGGDSHRNMGGSGGGMMQGGGRGWKFLIPVGVMSVFLGLVGSVVYGATRLGRSRSAPYESAMAILRERYARGELDEEEFAARKHKLQEEHSE